MKYRPVLVALAFCLYAAGMLASTVGVLLHSVWSFPSSAGAPIALVAAALLTGSPRFDSLRRRAERLAYRRGWTLALAVAGVHLLAALAAAYFVMGAVPNIEDGYAYWLQAQTFAQGRIAQADPGLAHFPLQWTMRHEGKLFSIFPPGFSLASVPFVWAGAPWAAPAFYGSLGVLAAYGFARALGGRLRAAVVLALTAASPQHVLLGASFLSHTPMLFFAFTAGALLLAARTERAPAALGLGAAAGLCVAMCALTRPVEGALVGALLVPTALWRAGARATRGRALVALVAFALFAALGPVAYGLYNQALTGTVRPALELIEPANRYGFGPTVGMDWGGWSPSPGHSPLRAAYNANFNFVTLNGAAFGWPVPALTFAWLACCFALRRRFVALAALWIFGIAAAYAPYWYHGVAIGARFYHLMIPWLAWLTVDGLAWLARRARAVGAPPRFTRAAPPAALAAMTALALALYLPRHLAWWPHPHGRAFSGEAVRLARGVDAHNAVVFLRGNDRAVAPAILLNRWPLGSGDVIYAHDRGPGENAALLRRFPGRAAHYVDVPYPGSTVARSFRDEFNRF